jgi:tellurite resistance protein
VRFVSLLIPGLGALVLFAQAPPALTDAQSKELTERVCSACHDISVVTSEKHTEAQWKATVADMVRRGAEASESEQQTILAYLVKNLGK